MAAVGAALPDDAVVAAGAGVAAVGAATATGRHRPASEIPLRLGWIELPAADLGSGETGPGPGPGRRSVLPSPEPARPRNVRARRGAAGVGPCRCQAEGLRERRVPDLPGCRLPGDPQ